MKKIVPFILILFTSAVGISQSNNQLKMSLTLADSLHWTAPITFTDFADKKVSLLHVVGAEYRLPTTTIPYVSFTTKLPYYAENASINFKVLGVEKLSPTEEKLIQNQKINAKVTPTVTLSMYRKQQIATVDFTPLYQDPQTKITYKVTAFSYEIIPSAQKSQRATHLNFKTNSVLRSGTWVKIGVTEDGIYKITQENLAALGINTSNLASKDIRIFGNGGGFLPFNNSVERIDDLAENAIKIEDGGDGVFNNSDYLLFYGQGPDRWKLINGEYRHIKNYFSDTTYYYITTDYKIGTPKRITTAQPIAGSPDVTVNTFTDYQFHELDLVNFVKSGRNWYGESFSFTKSRSISFNFPNVVPNSAKINSRAAFRVINKSGTINYSINNTQILSLTHGGVSGGYYAPYAGIVFGSNNFNAPSNFDLKVTFANNSSYDNAWLDYIEVICERNLALTGNQMTFRSTSSASANIIQYNLSNTNGYEIWNVTDPTNAQVMQVTSNSFKSAGGQTNEFVAFNNSNFKSVKNFGIVPNQDLHSYQQADYIIITHPSLINQANQLADFHRRKSNLNTIVVTTQQVYNEFSSGSADITAMKMFLKMLYDRAGMDQNLMPRYVLLFGDASYDYKHRLAGNTNMVPTYQSWDSESPLGSYMSDDYMGFLDDNEADELSATLDVGMGRIMAQTPAQAQAIVDKTINYMENPTGLNSWRNWLTFVGDDEDGNIHMTQSDFLATKVENNYPDYNLNKIFLDAFQQVSNSGGSTYPDVNIAIDQATEKGCLIMNYVGHGGELGWAHERILGLTQINGYKNFDRLALYLTATCEFSRFDDPERSSAGEQTLLNPNGGALGLLTTTRLVYSTPNFELSKKFFDIAFEKINGERPRLGDLLQTSKIGGANINYRNFSLLGDPAAKLSYPSYQVETTMIPDTIKSLQKVTISGEIKNEFNQTNTSFNGVLYPVVFGKKRNQSTLNNDGTGIFNFHTQTNALFNGKVSVTNGKFEFSFIVPKDIDFNYGAGKISYYAENGTIDASGNFQNFQIGGQEGDPNSDQEGPIINLFMNDESFINGGLTDNTPLIFAKIYDQSGINTVGSGIGHDIVAVIDENTANAIILNDYYESDLNSYQSGQLAYKLSNLENGKHTLRLKAWDVYNNSSEAVIEFTVSNGNDFELKNVLNYPNPFTTNTDFHFDHNAIGQQIEVRIQIFTISGKLVKTIDVIEQSESYHIGPINWNGRDEYGDKLAKGTYIYKVKATNSFNQTVEIFEKLVIL